VVLDATSSFLPEAWEPLRQLMASLTFAA